MNRKTSHDSETPAVGQQVFTACAFIHRKVGGKEKVLLAKRADSKKFLPGVYELPGGHINFGEDMKEGLRREIEEELEVKISIGDPFFVFTGMNPIKGSNSIEVTMFLNTPDEIKIHPEDHSAIIWVSEEEIPSIYTHTKGSDDIEVEAIRKGFSFLKGIPCQFV